MITDTKSYKLARDDVDLSLSYFHTTSTTPDTAGGGCGCCSGGPAGDGGGDHSGHCHHCGGHEEETQRLRTAAVGGRSCVHERRVQW